MKTQKKNKGPHNQLTFTKMQFTPQELKAIKELISRANITGGEAVGVARLHTKIDANIRDQEQVQQEDNEKSQE